MKPTEQNITWISNFIWGIADDVLRDVFVRGKYRDVILPMIVLRRFDVLLEPTKADVLEMHDKLNSAKVDNQDQALRKAAGQAFYNTSKFRMRDLMASTGQQQLRLDFEAYLNGFSPNVQEIIENFKFRNQISTLSEADALGTLIEKFLAPELNLSPNPVLDPNGKVKQPGLDNHAMGTIFEELIRKFNEANNEEAGEHWTPRDAVKLMTNLIFRPIEDQIESSTYLLYDGALGTGGMLTVAEETLQQLGAARGKEVVTHLYGQEINPETFAIAKADLLIKGEEADDIVGGPAFSTLSNDRFAGREFDFMLSNPPYGKSWKTDLEKMGGKAGLTDPRFVVDHDGSGDYSMVTRTSDGQMLFLANLVSKMKQNTALGSRIAEVHNGSSLFTGDAGQGESNIRRWVIENDWLEAIIALPLNMFYNTGIATYIWVLTNRKPEHRKGKVQLIDATKRFTPLRKNLGSKSCELSESDTEAIIAAFLAFEERDQDNVESKIFDNREFGYWKVTVERPLRLKSQLSPKAIDELRYASGDREIRAQLRAEFGDDLVSKFASVARSVSERLEDWGEGDGDSGDDEDEEANKKGLPAKTVKKLLDPRTWERDQRLVETFKVLREMLGDAVFNDHNVYREETRQALKDAGIKIGAAELKMIWKTTSWRDESAPRVVAKRHKQGKVEADSLAGLFQEAFDGSTCVVEYEADPELRDSEQVPLLEKGGVRAFVEREVLPYAPDAWVKEPDAKIGYEVSFNRYFYRPVSLRSLDQIRSDIALLNEQKQSIVYQAVTRGLDPDTPCKPSVLPWLSVIPASWDVVRAKTIFDVIDERSMTGAEELLTVSAARGIVSRASAAVTMFKASSYIGHKLCSPGDLVVNSLWAWAGGLGFSSHRGIISTAYSVYRLKPEFQCYADFLHNALRSVAYKWEFGVRSKGIWVSRLQLSDESFMAMPILLPPKADAGRIVAGLRASVEGIDADISVYSRQIELLSEYRSRLVSDVVTGKLDVREAVGSLPETTKASVQLCDQVTLSSAFDEAIGDAE